MIILWKERKAFIYKDDNRKLKRNKSNKNKQMNGHKQVSEESESPPNPQNLYIPFFKKETSAKRDFHKKSSTTKIKNNNNKNDTMT